MTEHQLFQASQDFRDLLLQEYFKLCTNRWAVIEKHVIPGAKGGRGYKTWDPERNTLSNDIIRMNKRQLKAHTFGALPGCISNCYFRMPPSNG